MSKVVHLTDEAHRRAKDFCKQQGLKMSDWVAKLIDEAVTKKSTTPVTHHAPPPAAVHVPAAPTHAPAPTRVQGLMPKKKILDRLQAAPAAIAEEQVPAYSQPPFWARKGAG